MILQLFFLFVADSPVSQPRAPQMSLREVRLRQRCDLLDLQFRDICVELEEFGNRAITTRVSFVHSM